MFRTKKFLGMLLVLAIVAALVGVGVRAFNPWGDKHHEMNAQGYAQQFENGKQQGLRYAEGQDQGYAQGQDQGYAQGQDQGYARGVAQSRRGGHEGMYNAQQRGEHGDRGEGGKFVMLFGDLLLVVAGWLIWKRGRSNRRWIGAVLIAIALLPLLAMALSLVVPAIVLYLIWRFFFRRPAQPEVVEFATEPVQTRNTVDYLDEWEANTRRQRNQKEDK